MTSYIVEFAYKPGDYVRHTLCPDEELQVVVCCALFEGMHQYTVRAPSGGLTDLYHYELLPGKSPECLLL